MAARAARRKRAARLRGNGRHPLTTTLAVLMRDGSDARFRRFLYDFLTISARMKLMREYLGRQSRLTGPQYTLLMAIMELSDGAGVAMRDLAEYLMVTPAFVTMESNRLIDAGVVTKRANPRDGRSNLLLLSAKGWRLVARLVPEVRTINDLFFSRLGAATFNRARRLVAELLEGSALALAHAATRRPVERPRPPARQAHL